MDIDPRVDIDAEENCALCGEPLLAENNLVLVEPGEMERSKRDPRFFYFVPGRNERPDTEATLSIFHCHCMLTLFEQRLDWGVNNCCLRCGEKFVEGHWAYALQVGTIDEDTLVFIPSEGINSRAFICADCAFEGFGEGDLEEGMALLEATG